MPESHALNAVRRARRVFDGLLVQYPNVVGLGVGYRQVAGEWTAELGIQVYVSRKYPKASLRYEQTLPPFLPGPDGETIPVDVIETGMFHVSQLPDVAAYRPLEGGCSVGGVAEYGAGTLGAWVVDNTDQEIVFLTCNHVLWPDATQAPNDLRSRSPLRMMGVSSHRGRRATSSAHQAGASNCRLDRRDRALDREPC
ncbi:MAG: hypothetical protein ACLP0J_04830 [Solirubrobacteraceae bacterium]